jgi:hypothetical protein
MAESRDKNLVRGIILIVAGIALALAGALWAHFTGADEFNDVGQEIFPLFPRGWAFVLIGQLASIAGLFLAIGGVALAFLYEKKMTWARASIGAFLFTSLMIVLYGVIPNQWLTYTQSVWNWTDQKLWVKIPQSLIGGNELNISAAAIKDFIAGGYYIVVTVAIGVAMVRYQKRDEYRTKREKKKAASAEVSAFGRPVQKAGS